MLNKVKQCSLSQLQSKLLGKMVRFTSDCKLFPNFDIKCKVIKIYQSPGEIIFDIISNKGTKTKIGGNMSNLSFEIL